MSEKYIRIRDAVDALAKTMPTPATPDGAGEFDHEIHIADEAFADAIRIIESLEPADVAPVIHGRWVNGSCGKCGKHAPYYLMSSTYYEGDFCPNCGAKMDGEE